MILHIQYLNDKYDYVNQQMLDDLINQKTIKQFFRPQEKKWINIDTDPIRGKGSFFNVGVERRHLTS